ncbi:hypothetical protein [Vibrio alfacsensis]|uniref:hypothetical protein n=1 Tax=Vibrio alfacsensis TaxID=1074311 RepID=UPI004068B8C5
MEVLLKLPFYDSDMARDRWHDLKLEGAPQWQQYPIILEPLESIDIQLSGRLVWYHRTRTTSGSCGKTKYHVDHREATPNEQPCRFAIQNTISSEIVYRFDQDVGEQKQQFSVSEALQGNGQLRLAGVLIESLNGGGGDNSGSYNLKVEVQSRARVNKFIDTLNTMKLQLEKLNPDSEVKGFYDNVLKWFPRRLPFYPKEHNEFLELLVAMAEVILKKKAEAESNIKQSWMDIAEWLAEWSVTPSAGGKESFANGWLCRGKIVSQQGNTTEALEFFAKAFDSSTEKDIVVYEYGKMLEFSGKLFSDSKLNVSHTSILDAIRNGSAAETLNLGAYEVYKLALHLRTKDGVNARELTPEDYIKSYDTHYAIARLAFLNHTTESLKQAAEHLRICRRLAPFRYFTNVALYNHYTLEMLLYDTLKTQRNPFFHTEDGNGEMPYIGFDSLQLKLKVVTVIQPDGGARLGGDSKPTLTTGNSWLAINNHKDDNRHRFNSVASKSEETSEAREHIEDIKEKLKTGPYFEQLNTQTGENHASSYLNVVFNNSIGECVEKQIHSFESAFNNNKERELNKFLFNRDPKRFDLLQNPALILTTFLKTCLVDAESSYYEDEFNQESSLVDELFAFEAFELDKQTLTGDQFTLTFKHKNIKYECKASLVKGRLQIRQLVIFNADKKLAIVSIEYKDNNKIERVNLSKRLIKSVTQAGGQAIKIDYTDLAEANETHYTLEFAYTENLLTQVTYSNLAIKKLLLSQGIVNPHVAVTLSFSFEHQNNQPLQSCMLKEHPSLQSAYIPFKNNVNESGFSKAESEDLIWLFKQPSADRAIRYHVLLEIGRRLVHIAHNAHQIDFDNVNFVFVYDVMLGQYIANTQAGEDAHSGLTLQAMAASCLLNLVEITGRLESRLTLTEEVALKKLLRILSRLRASGSVGDSITQDVLSAINQFVFTMRAPTPPWLVQEKEKESHSKLPLAETLTVQWLGLIPPHMNSTDTSISLLLASPLIASGLSQFAFDWLFSEATDTLPNKSPAIRTWFENEAIPDSKSINTQDSLDVAGDLALANKLLELEPEETQQEAFNSLRDKLGLSTNTTKQELIVRALETFCEHTNRNQVKVSGEEVFQCLSLMLALAGDEDHMHAHEAAKIVLKMVRRVCGIEAEWEPIQDFTGLIDKLNSIYSFQHFELKTVRPALDALVSEMFSAENILNYASKKVKFAASSTSTSNAYLGISPINYENVSQQQWELSLHDEPYSDEIAALIALSDRYLARKEHNNAKKYLLKARALMVKLDQESPILISDADSKQLPYWRNRIKVKLTWLDQGKDAYGRFITNAPPRRLSSIIDSFAGDVEKLKTYAEIQGKDAEKQLIQEQRTLTIKKELKSNEFEEKQARLDVEKNQRTIAFLQKSLSGLSGKRQELERQTQDALQQYNKGKKQSAAAAKSLGNLVAQAVVSQAPVIGTHLNLNAKTSQNIVKTLDVISKVQGGENPVKAAAQSFGSDLIDMTFSSVEPNLLFGVDLNSVITGNAEELIKTGSLDFEEMAKGTMRQMGEHLFNEHAKTLAYELEDFLNKAQVDVESIKGGWDEIKNTIESKLGQELVFNNLSEVRKFVDETVLNSDGRREILRATVDALHGIGKNKLEETVLALNNHDFPIEKVIKLYQNTDNLDGLLSYVEDAAKDELEKYIENLAPEAQAKINEVISAFNTEIETLLLKPEMLISCIISGAKYETYEAFNIVCDVINTSSNYIDVQTANIEQVKLLREQFLKLLGGIGDESSLIHAFKYIPFPRDRFNQLTLLQASELTFECANEDYGSSFEVYLHDIFKVLLQDELQTLEALKESIDILSRTLSIITNEILLFEEKSRSLGESLPEEIEAVKKSFEQRWTDFVTIESGSLSDNDKNAFKEYQLALLNRTENLVFQLLKQGHSALNEVSSWQDVLSDPKLILGNAPSEVFALLEKVINTPTETKNGLTQMVLDNLTSYKDEDLSLNSDVKFIPKDFIEEQAIESYLQQKSGAVLLRTVNEEEQKTMDSVNVDYIEAKAAQTRLSLPHDKEKQKHIAVIAPRDLSGGDMVREKEDFVADTLNNPGIQAALSALSMAYPMAGLAVQGAIAINNWLSGEAERKLGAKAIEKAQGRMRKLDREVSETRHQRELVLIEQINANDNVERIRQERILLREAKDLSSEASDQSIVMRRYNYRRLWVNLELINYKLYILQKAFEYEYDVPIEQLSERYPEYKTFNSLFEISPGTLAGEFNRSNVLSNMLPALNQLEDLKNTIKTHDDVVKHAKYRDSLTFSLSADFPEVWDLFKHQSDALSPINFTTTLQHFSGVMMQSKSMRHSYKIERVSLVPELTQSKDRGTPVSIATIDTKLEKASTATSFSSPKAMRESLEAEIELQRQRELIVVRRDISRFKTALFHSGVGPQINEDGKLRVLEWGPQVSDSNLEVVDPESNYNFAEGLTPATDWTIVFDSSSTLTPKHLSDIKLTIQFTYCRHEENARHFHLYLNQGGGMSSQEYVSANTNEVENTRPQSTILSKLNAKFRNKSLH